MGFLRMYQLDASRRHLEGESPFETARRDWDELSMIENGVLRLGKSVRTACCPHVERLALPDPNHCCATISLESRVIAKVKGS